MGVKKILCLFSAAVISAQMLFIPACADWEKSEKGYSYKDSESGESLVGWQTIDGNTYYFDKDGIALTGWQRLGDLGNVKRYYFIVSDKGRMAKGWVRIKGETYYFRKNDGVLCTGVQKIGGKMYCFDKNGKLYKDTVLLIKGVNYFIDEKGVVTNQLEIEDEIVPPDKPMENLEWGMTEKEVVKALGLKKDDYVTSGSQLAVKQKYEGAEQLTYYISEDKGLQCYSLSRQRYPKNSNTHEYGERSRGRINTARWHRWKTYSDDNFHLTVYYRGDNILFFMGDEETVITFVFSEEISSGFFSGEKTPAEILKAAT